MSPRDLPHVAELLQGHVHGWARCRGRAPVEMPLGWRVQLDRPDELVRLIITRGSVVQVHDLLSAATPLTTLRMAGDPGWWRARLPDGWVVDRQGWYFAVPLDQPVEPPLQVVVDGDHDVLRAHVVEDGTTVATGMGARWQGWLTLDSIEVVPARRREGLGSAVVSALCEAGRRRGCTTGVLNATPMGRHLYAAMGWTEVATQVCATRT